MLNRPHIRFRPGFWSVVTLALIVFFAVFLLYPISSMAVRSFQSTSSEGFTLRNYIDFFTLKYYYSTLGRSMFIGFASTLVSTAVGVLLAYLMTRYNVWGKKTIKILFIIALMSPPFIGAYSWILLLGRSGIITKGLGLIGISMPSIYGRTGIILVFALGLSCYVFLYVSAALANIDSSLEEAAENLGSGRLRRIFTVTLPVVIPTITSAMVLVFMRSLADFGTPLLIGEGYKTLPVLVYNAYLSEMGGDAYLASAFSMIIILCSSVILLLQHLFVSRRNYAMTSMRPPAEVKLRGWKRVLATLPCVLWVLVALLPQITVVISSFITTKGPIFVGGFTLGNYAKILSTLGKDIRNSFVFSGVAIVLIVLIGITTAFISVRRRSHGGSLLDMAVMFPYVIPGAVLGICFIVAFNKPPIMIAGTALILIISYIVRKLPYTVRSSAGILEQIDPSVDEASINLGVPPMRTFFRITARLMAPGIAAGAILSWISVVNELSSTLLLYSANTATMTVSIFTLVSHGDYGYAAALATVLTLSTVAALVLFFKISKGKISVV